MENPHRDRCAGCSDALWADIAVCSACEAPHHADCWRARGHCAACMAAKPPRSVRGRPPVTLAFRAAVVFVAVFETMLVATPQKPGPMPPIARVEVPASTWAWTTIAFTGGEGMFETMEPLRLGAGGVEHLALKLPSRDVQTVLVWARALNESRRRLCAQLLINVADVAASGRPDRPGDAPWKNAASFTVPDSSVRVMRALMRGHADSMSLFVAEHGRPVMIERIVLLEPRSFDARTWVPRGEVTVRALHKDTADLLHRSWASAHVPARLIRRSGPPPAPVLITQAGVTVRLADGGKGVEFSGGVTKLGPGVDRWLYERRLLEQLDPPGAALARRVESLDVDLTLLSDGTAEIVGGGKRPFVWPLHQPADIESVAANLRRADRFREADVRSFAGNASIGLAVLAPPDSKEREQLLASLADFRRRWSERLVPPEPIALADRVVLVCVPHGSLVVERHKDGAFRLVELSVRAAGIEPWSGWIPEKFFDGPAASLVGQTMQFVRVGKPALRTLR